MLAELWKKILSKGSEKLGDEVIKCPFENYSFIVSHEDKEHIDFFSTNQEMKIL